MEYKDKITEFKRIIDESSNICVFTGAGISCPSGIPDFRSADGLYNEKTNSRYTPEQMISHTFFVNRTELFYEFYKSKMLYPNAEPNAAHLYFAGLEKAGKDVSVVTQNIDGLHQKAGSTRVYELHGSVHRNYCTKCGRFYDLETVAESVNVPLCNCGGIIKPDVVLYEEPLDEKIVRKAISAISSADTMIIIGTSLVVYPAASYVRYFSGKHLILLNKSETSYDNIAEIAIYDDVVNVIKALNEQ